VTTTDAGDITLNFEEAELRQVVMVILGELLDETYYMDPAIKGTVTVHNDNSLRRDQLLPILEELLQMNGAALVQAPGGYKIVPLGEAERQALPPSAARWPPTASRGYTVQIIPLEFASADEVASVLAPYVPEGGSLHSVPQRNILILAAPGHSIEGLHGGRRARAAPGHCRWLAHGRYGAPVPHRTPQLAAGGHFPAALSAGDALVDRRSGPRR
jgi:general secretion pathway protein D